MTGIIAAGVMAFFSIYDIREKGVPLLPLAAALALSFCYLPVRACLGGEEFWELVAGALPGIGFLLASFASGGRIGCGDGLALLFAGNLLGFRRTLEAAVPALGMLFVCSAVLFIRGRARREAKIPFLPFLTAGMALQAFIERWGG